jgi:hypothetical protein
MDPELRKENYSTLFGLGPFVELLVWGVVSCVISRPSSGLFSQNKQTASGLGIKKGVIVGFWQQFLGDRTDSILKC